MSLIKILVEGPALTRSGYGVHTRLVLQALRQRNENFDIYVNPLDWGATSWLQSTDSEEIQWIHNLVAKFQVLDEKSKNFDVHIHIGIPVEFTKKAPYSVCVTAGIEATKIAPEWIKKSYEMNKIIVPSNFAKWGFENTFYTAQDEKGQQFKAGCGAPVEVVSYPVREYGNHVDLELELKDDFNFLCVAQWGIRKNVENTILWFLEEFKDEEVGLVLKTNMAKNCTPDREYCLERIKALLDHYELTDTKASIYLLHGEMSNQEIDSLYRQPKIKAMITATHGEGFGLPLFEAAYNELPIVAPGWSGHLDFLYGPVRNKKTKKVKNRALFAKVDYKLKHIQPEAAWDGVLVQDAMWCYPSNIDFKDKMRAVYKDYSFHLSRAKKLASHLKSTLSLENILQKMLTTLIPEKWLIKPEYVFVSDLFIEDYVGGAELSLQTLYNKCESNKKVKFRSAELTEEFLQNNKDAKWVFGNIANLPDEIVNKVHELGLDYTFVEFDYKFCKHRNPKLYEMVERTTCDYKNTERGKALTNFCNNANSVFFMSQKQMDIHKEYLPGLKADNLHVLSSLFDDQFFAYIDRLKSTSKSKNNKWIILGSRSWVKGFNETESYCKEKEYDYEVLWNLNYKDFLEKLAESKGLCFKPTGLDTCPRMVIEAKLLGCELDINDLVQHKDEEWFTKGYEEIKEYLIQRPVYFWENAFKKSL